MEAAAATKSAGVKSRPARRWARKVSKYPVPTGSQLESEPTPGRVGSSKVVLERLPESSAALGETDPGYAGQRGETRLELAIERIDGCGLVADQGGINAEQENVAGIEARVDGAKVLQSADEQARAHENHDAQSDLCDGERLAQADEAPAPTRCGIAGAIPERAVQIHAHAARCGSKAEQNPAQKRNAGGEEEYADIDVAGETGWARRSAGNHCQDGANADPGESQPGDASKSCD